MRVRDWQQGISVGLGGMALVVAGPILASELIYRPVNPNFGGSPFNADILLGTADRQNGFRDDEVARPGDDISDRFIRSLQSRLLSGLAREVTDSIFGEQPLDEGSFTVGDQTVSFVRGLETIQVEIINEADGTSTLIEVPLVEIE